MLNKLNKEIEEYQDNAMPKYSYAGFTCAKTELEKIMVKIKEEMQTNNPCRECEQRNETLEWVLQLLKGEIE